MFLWEEYYVPSPSLELVLWHHATVWSVLSQQNKAQVIYVFIVSHYMRLQCKIINKKKPQVTQMVAPIV